VIEIFIHYLRQLKGGDNAFTPCLSLCLCLSVVTHYDNDVIALSLRHPQIVYYLWRHQ